MTVFLDTGVLGYITHPHGSKESRECTAWLLALLGNGARICLPEICDYELRREYLLGQRGNALKKLDALKTAIEFIPLNSSMMIKAAELWASLRAAGKPTADPKALDADVILGAQAITLIGSANFCIATTNVGHLSNFADAREWRAIT